MDKKDFDILVDNYLITDIGLTTHYLNNPDKLKNITPNELIEKGVMSQPATNQHIIKYGVNSLLVDDYNDICNEADLKNACNIGGKFKLKNDIEIDDMITVYSDIELHLNNCTLSKKTNTASGKCVLFYINEANSKLTITGEGNIQALGGLMDIAIWASNGGEVVINSGNFYGVGKNGSDLIYAFTGGKITINGGTFELEYPNESNFAKSQYSILNVYNGTIKNAKDSIIVYGGIFHNFDPMNNVSEGIGTNFVAEGYKSISIGENIYKVISI